MDAYMEFGNSLVQSSSASASVSKAYANIATNPASNAATPSNDHTEEDQGTESGGGNKRRRGGGHGSRKKTSIAWKHFEEFIDEETGIRKGKCNYCGVEYFADPNKNGTSSMIAHIPKCDKNPNNPKNRSTQTQLAFGNKEVDEITGKMKANLLAWKFDQDVVRKAVAYMIIVDELPFRFVEGRGFRSSLNPKIVQALICAQDWLRSAGEPLTVEETLEDLYKFEEDMAVSEKENNVIDRL